jgi:hypothetical protein
MTLQLQLAPAPAITTLQDGSTSWNQVAVAALADWSQYIATLKFSSVISGNPPPTSESDSNNNNVFWDDTVYGESWGGNTGGDAIGITIIWTTTTSGSGGTTYFTTEADVLFNANVAWNSYRGDLQGNVSDLKRVALHEFGHVLGLNHPDQATPPQTVAAIMNSVVSNTDDLTSDDIAGAEYLYGTPSLVQTIPAFTLAASPSSVTVASGRSVAFNAIATGTPAPTYQWTLNGSTTIPGATGTTDSVLLVTGATSANSGTYTCTATNSQGFVTTSAALSVVTSATPGYLTDLSSRATVGTGGNIVIAGFAIGGSGSMDLLLRGVGPTLAESPYDVPDALSTPQLTLYDSSAAPGPYPIVTNTRWGGTFTLGTSSVHVAPKAATAALMSSVGAFPLASGSADSALEVTPPVGSYTSQISGVGGATGVVLAEIYDADAYTSATRLANISARADVGVGSNILIGGFAIGGNTAETVLIRAVGPTLAGTPYNVAGTLAQPALAVYSGTTLIYSNTGWAGDATIAGTFGTVGAFALNSSNQDSVLLITLPPASNYTAQVTGVSNGTGIALVEIYELH